MIDDRVKLKEMLDLRIAQFQRFKDDKQNAAIFQAAGLMKKSLRAGGKILIFGNGGSATQSSHFAAELVNRFYLDRRPLPALALSADMANLTSIANDTDYRSVFSRQVEALGKPGDVAVGISTSGKSPNVLEAFAAARRMGLKVVAICGAYTDRLRGRGTGGAADVVVGVPASDTPVIQEMHLFILHWLAETLENEFSKEVG
jgi:D-sedoheptulose 7-phosphate isomerase